MSIISDHLTQDLQEFGTTFYSLKPKAMPLQIRTLTRRVITKNDDHATIAPSSFKRTLNCPVSVVLSWDLPEKRRSDFAEGGHNAHHVGGVFTTAKLSGEPFPYHEFKDEKYTEEMIKCAEDYANRNYKEIEPYLQFKHTWFVETRFVLDKERDVWGTLDFVFAYRFKTDNGVEKLRLIIRDYKFGEGIEVDVIENWQLMIYALAAMSYFGRYFPIDKIECHIDQPRIDQDDSKPTTIVYEPEFLLNETLPIVQQRADLIYGWIKQGFISDEDLQQWQNVDPTPGLQSWCHFCKAQAICKPYIQANGGDKSLVLLKTLTAKLGKKKNQYTDLNAALKRGIISMSDLEDMALHSTKVQNIAKAAPKILMSLAAKGVKFEKTKVIQTSSKRSFIKDTVKLIKGLKKLGIKAPVRTVEKIISISDAEKTVGSGKLPAHLIVNGGPNYKIVDINHKEDGVSFGLDNLKMLRGYLNKEESEDEGEE